ncbi:unnamed protein product [Pleuronectes platessa]|uniref:Uncharacterized protein n=1 Tax=Pleuronectes platessa TaxID=8262 RepID=A0A9N7TK26_PLEPL|nr:unnamed protein product [Pleuronectes platessa]
MTIRTWASINVGGVKRHLIDTVHLRGAGAKPFETQSVFGSQITIRSLVSPRSLLSDRQLALLARGGGEENRKRLVVWSSVNAASWRRTNTHRVQQAPVGSRQGAAHCKK